MSSSSAVDRLVALARTQHVEVQGYYRKDGTHVESYVRLGVAGAKTLTVNAEDLRAGDYISDAGKVKRVESAASVLDSTVLRVIDGQGRRSTKRTKRKTRFQKIILGLMAVAIALGIAGGLANALKADAPHHDQNPVSATVGDDDGPDPDPDDGPDPDPNPTTPEPTTAQGYAKMFDKVSTAEWGGADVSYSADIDNGRRAWVYGDTLSGNNGFVHSTMIIQNGGELHVANGGKQILPDGGTHVEDGQTRTKIYWPEIMRHVGDGKIEIVAAETSVGTKSVWDFHRTDMQKSRVGVVQVDDAGDVTFLGWKGWEPRPDLSYDEGEDMRVDPNNPHHFFYAEEVHENIPLAGGKHLVTTAQNWDDDPKNHFNADGSFRFEDWRPIFSAQ